MEKIYREFGGAFSNLTVFQAVFAACTQNFETCILPKKASGTSIESNCFFYKADINLKFKFGASEIWEFCNKRYLSPQAEYMQRLNRLKALEEECRKKELETKTKGGKKQTVTSSTAKKSQAQVITVVKR